MRKNEIFFATLTITAFVAIGGALAEQQLPHDPQKTPLQRITVNKDFGKLSTDGSAAFHDLSLTRLAIFNGHIDEAKKFINQADAAFKKATDDEAVFTKAESDFTQPNTVVGKSAIAPEPAGTGKTGHLKEPIAWLPVEGSITIDEDYAVDPAKTAAVAEANKRLAAGDRKGAVEKLKLANVKVAVELGVMPLEQTIVTVHQAADLINDGRYYEASQKLRQAQAGERFDAFGGFMMPRN